MYILHGKHTSFDSYRYYNWYDLHRENGPAVEYFDGRKEWWYNNEKINCQTQEEFERLMKMRAFW